MNNNVSIVDQNLESRRSRQSRLNAMSQSLALLESNTVFTSKEQMGASHVTRLISLLPRYRYIMEEAMACFIVAQITVTCPWASDFGRMHGVHFRDICLNTESTIFRI